ncbi:MAG TPA: hypothetical protein VM912_02800 [Terriglobales bacterium]|nr:hypothetical protein [Terriglobales bacterium]
MQAAVDPAIIAFPEDRERLIHILILKAEEISPWNAPQVFEEIFQPVRIKWILVYGDIDAGSSPIHFSGLRSQRFKRAKPRRQWRKIAAALLCDAATAAAY